MSTNNSRSELVQKRISKGDDRPVEITQTEILREEWRNMNRGLREMWAIMKDTNVCAVEHKKE